MYNPPDLTRSILVLLLCSTLVLVPFVPNAATAHPIMPASVIALLPQQNGFSISPSTGVQGTVQDITVTSAQCLAGVAAASLAGVTLYAPQGSGITVSNVNVPAAGAGLICNSIFRFTIAASASLGPVKVSLAPAAGGALLASLDFTITGLAAGPIPPQLNNQGQVDVMWDVVPSAIINDNFGGRIAKQYYAIDVVIGNDSGYDLQLASIGFTVPSLNTGNLKYKVPGAGYRLVRGSLQSREQLAPRNFILNAVKIAGPILTGFTPFFHNVNHKANFTEFINILSNPFEKGLDLIFPDLIPLELNRLADQAFRDDITTKTIIPNNLQARVLTFVPKKLLYPTNPSNNIQDVMHKLGEIVLIGDQVTHVNRIRVVSTPLGPAPTDFSVSGKVIDGCNTGVGGVTMTISAGAGFVSQQVTTQPDGTYIFANVPAGRTYTVTPSLAAMPAATFQPTSNGLQTFTLNDNQTNVSFSTPSVVVIQGNVITTALAPVAGATITLATSPGGVAITTTAPITTNAQGNFSVIIPTPAAGVNVNVTATRAAPAANTTQLWTCANPRVTLQL